MAFPLSPRFWRRTIDLPPPAVLSLLYAGLVIVGALALKLPWAARGVPATWSEALFTATSAVTVTGLSVVDTGSHFTFFGQLVVLVLIQLGGLGLMTFAVLVLTMLGLPVGVSQRVFLREELNQTSFADLLRLVRQILRVVVVCEVVGIVLLAFVFVPDFGAWEGLWQAIFHSISAFNNAGFSLFADNLSGYVFDPIINLVVPALFVIGGIGFIVTSDIMQKRQWRRFTLHTKLMLVVTLALIVWSVVGFAALEWNNPATLGQYHSIIEKLTASWFQGLTTRTAGFNTIDMSGIHDATALMFMSLMFIGGGSTSTAGGIKVTTFVVLLLATVAFFRQRPNLHAFGRSLGREEVMKVLALSIVSVMVVMGAIFTISLSHDGDFLDLAFEVTSAFGTVGLSRGATAELDTLGRFVIILVMFIGRVGPLTLGFFLATKVPPRIRYPSSRIYLG
ncbi:TrkH family potassium uptake protein [Afifella sp. JA880]|uniref:TrkH family potassium uptake protein n=1 Tax=Afifella sp. JA880 TaxID=2975280 RepID=UPI0021BB9836|nr:TrkH family potassium uptake protein [Afifella sp. JA880]MCT8265853.1 TrkH family potassium uptake protein [Afifella sp. JA880]